jgi:RNA polymerase sigma-70 factor (ECF subfamily)
MSAEADEAVRADDLARLVEAIARCGDREAFAALFQLFAPRVKGYLMRLGLPPAAAEELAQETLLAVWRRAALFDPSKATAATWIFTIARNLRISAARREKAALAYSVDLSQAPEEPEQPESVVRAGERERAVKAALEALTPDQAMVLMLSFYQEKPQAEIARDLGLPLGTVKSRVRLALARLRKALEHLA